MKFGKKRRILFCCFLLIFIIAGCKNTDESVGKEEKKQELNIGIQPSAAFLPLYLAKEKGSLEEALKEQNVEVKWHEFESGPPINEALAAGFCDIGVMGDVPAVSAIAAGQEVEIIATAAIGPESYALLTWVDSQITSPEDLKGKVIGTTIGSTGHNLVEKLLEKQGLFINQDIELVNISAGDASAVLSGKEVDAVAIWEPNITKIVDSNIGKIIGDGSDCDLRGVNPILVRKKYAQENPEVLKIFLEQYQKAAEELYHMDEATQEAVAKCVFVDSAQLGEILKKYRYPVAISQEDVDSLQDTISFLVKIGNLKEEFSIQSYLRK